MAPKFVTEFCQCVAYFLFCGVCCDAFCRQSFSEGGADEEQSEEVHNYYCCLDVCPRANEYIRKNFCCLCGCCCTKWPKILNERMREVEKSLGKAVAATTKQSMKAQIDEEEKDRILKAQRAILMGLDRGKISEELFNSQFNNALLAAENLHDSQVSAIKIRLLLRHFSYMHSTVESALAGQKVLNSIKAYSHLLGNVGVGKETMTTDAAGNLILQDYQIFSNINDTVSAIHKVVDKQLSTEDAKERFGGGKLFNVRNYRENLVADLNLPPSYLGADHKISGRGTAAQSTQMMISHNTDEEEDLELTQVRAPLRHEMNADSSSRTAPVQDFAVFEVTNDEEEERFNAQDSEELKKAVKQEEKALRKIAARVEAITQAEKVDCPVEIVITNAENRQYRYQDPQAVPAPAAAPAPVAANGKDEAHPQ